MRIVKNPVLGTWEMAESDEPIPVGGKDLEPCNQELILIADDEPNMRRLFMQMLQKSLPDFEYETASNGLETVDVFLDRRPHVILLDMIMPVMDGEEAFYQIADHCQNYMWQCPKFIFCSGHSPSVGIRNVVASDPSHCLLQKPIRQQTLIMAVQKRVGKTE